MNKNKFSIRDRIRSFGYAIEGLKTLWKEEHNARIHILISVCAILLSFALKISLIEWALIMVCIGFVIALEIINTGIEHIADFISPEKHSMIQKIKDLSAAAVLVGAIVALSVGLLIFMPKIFDL